MGKNFIVRELDVVNFQAVERALRDFRLETVGTAFAEPDIPRAVETVSRLFPVRLGFAGGGFAVQIDRLLAFRKIPGKSDVNPFSCFQIRIFHKQLTLFRSADAQFQLTACVFHKNQKEIRAPLAGLEQIIGFSVLPFPVRAEEEGDRSFAGVQLRQFVQIHRRDLIVGDALNRKRLAVHAVDIVALAGNNGQTAGFAAAVEHGRIFVKRHDHFRERRHQTAGRQKRRCECCHQSHKKDLSVVEIPRRRIHGKSPEEQEEFISRRNPQGFPHRRAAGCKSSDCRMLRPQAR